MRLASITVVLCLAVGHAGSCDTWYVNNQGGDDANDGRSAKTAFATIAKATASAATSDTLILANTGVAYREPIAMQRLGGTPAAPFVIEGNGATITGLKSIPAKEWQRRDNGVCFYPVPKKPYGFPFLVQRGRRLTAGKSAEALEPGQFFWGKDGIAFRPAKGKSIEGYQLEATLVVSGLQVSSSSYIVCRNLVSEFHSNDGFNVHGDCRGIVCENIVGRHNGDDGFSIHEVIGAVVRNGYFHHNRWGIQDVNGSRSVFNGVTAEHNEINGVNFVGGYHSLVDSIVRDNGRDQIAITANRPKHLVGSEHNPLCQGLVFLQNVLVEGGTVGLSVSNGARVTARHCTFVRSDIGVTIHRESTLHLTASILAECASRELASASDACFRDHNLYHPGRFCWHDKDFGPDDWDAFRQAAGHDAHSLLAQPRLMRDGTWDVLPDSPAHKHKPRIGPTEPVRGYVAAVGAWGEAVGGLSCRLVAERGAVPVGARPVFHLHFRIDPRGLGAEVQALNRFLHPRCVTLTFADQETGEVVARRPDGGVPELPMMPRPEDFARLRGRPVGPERLRVRLLSTQGQQLPAGRYRVVATYANDGRNNREAYKGPGSLWSGTVTTPPIPLTVVAAGPEPIEIRFHTALEFQRKAGSIGYAWSEKNPQVLRLTRRPGYVVGTQWQTRIFLDGKEAAGGGGGLSGGTWLAGGESFLEPALVKRVAAGASLRVRKDVTIFETSVPPGHHWAPEAGDYRPLWKGSIEGTLPGADKEGKR